MKKAVVLVSGGLDSAVVLFLARSQGYECLCLAFDYGQRHIREIKSARSLARAAGCALQILKIPLPWKGSSLLDRAVKLPRQVRPVIPNTYVPGRNIIFLSFALSYAEAIGASAIFIGAHAQDYSGYPDCRPDFFAAFRKAAASGTKCAVERKPVRINTPLIGKSKAQIIRLGARLGVPFGLTWSCYAGLDAPCKECDSCYFRAKGFKDAQMEDPLLK